MRDGWWLQEILGLQAGLLAEEHLARQLIDVLAQVPGEDVETACVSLASSAARARDFVHWLEFLGFALPTTVLVTGGTAAGNSGFVADLVDGSAIFASDIDPATHAVTVYGFRTAAMAVRGSASERPTTIRLAEYIEQIQCAGQHIQSTSFVDALATWTIARFLIIENADVANPFATKDDDATQYSLGGVDVVLYLVDTNIGTVSEIDEQWLCDLRMSMPRAVIHIIFTESDTVSAGQLDVLHAAWRMRYDELFDGQTLTYSKWDGLASRKNGSRDAIARLLWQLVHDREGLEQRQLLERVTRHIQLRRSLYAQLHELVGRLVVRQRADGVGAQDGSAMQCERIKALLNAYGELNMRLP